MEPTNLQGLNITEQEIVIACQNGEVDQFTILYDLYVKKIYGYIYNKTMHRETAEDITSQTFMKALEKIASYNTEKASFATWLYQIARNTVIDHYRTKKQHVSLEDAWDISTKEDLAHDTDVHMHFDKLQEHLKAFKSEHRDILMMKLWLGMSYKEIGEAVGKTENNVKQINSRTIRKLRDTMAFSTLLLLILSLPL